MPQEHAAGEALSAGQAGVAPAGAQAPRHAEEVQQGAENPPVDPHSEQRIQGKCIHLPQLTMTVEVKHALAAQQDSNVKTMMARGTCKTSVQYCTKLLDKAKADEYAVATFTKKCKLWLPYVLGFMVLFCFVVQYNADGYLSAWQYVLGHGQTLPTAIGQGQAMPTLPAPDKTSADQGEANEPVQDALVARLLMSFWKVW
jgi:hypothetical protein